MCKFGKNITFLEICTSIKYVKQSVPQNISPFNDFEFHYKIKKDSKIYINH